MPEGYAEITLDEFEKTEIERRWIVLGVVWALFLAGPVASLVIATVLGTEAASAVASDTSEPTYLVKYALSVMSAMVLSLAFLVRRAATNPRGRINRFASSYLVSMIVAGSLCESVSIYGLAVFFVEGACLWLYLLVGISAVALVVLRPRKRELIDLAIHSRQNHRRS